jgi:hypothetical protein
MDKTNGCFLKDRGFVITSTVLVKYTYQPLFNISRYLWLHKNFVSWSLYSNEVIFFTSAVFHKTGQKRIKKKQVFDSYKLPKLVPNIDLVAKIPAPDQQQWQYYPKK